MNYLSGRQLVGTIADNLNFLFLLFVYPSPGMVGVSRGVSYFWCLDIPFDHDLIEDHSTSKIRIKNEQSGSYLQQCSIF